MDYDFLERTFSKTSAIELCFDGLTSLCRRSPPLAQEGTTRRVRMHVAPLNSGRLSVAYLEYGKQSGEGLMGTPYGCSFMLKFSDSAEALRDILGGGAALQRDKVAVPRTTEGIYSGCALGSNFVTSFFIMEHYQKTPIGIADSIPTSIS